MQSNLNSVILEGKLIKRGDRFYVKSTKAVPAGEGSVSLISTTIGLDFSKLALRDSTIRVFNSEPKKTHRIRVVGYLAPGIILKADHIEFCSEPKL